MTWKLNTSNPGKLAEFKEFLGDDIEVIDTDLAEPDSDPITIVRYKASQFENVLVDDTSLFIEGYEAGANIRWLLSELPKLIGRKATFVCLLGLHREGKVEIFEGRVTGTLVSARGESYGFNRYFVPDGAVKTYAEEKPNHLNARYLAVQNMLAKKPHTVEAPLREWSGAFQ